LASSSAPEAAFAELERVAGLLEEELANWRRRCLKAEAEVEDARGRVPQVTAGDMALMRQRVNELETENASLRSRIASAREQVEQLRTRLRFVGDPVEGTLR
jgi:chromosome segregation ATPase